jgi:type II secretory pathway pseudopilin PulG
VELLVVVAIIGILATIITVNYSGAQVKSRDTRRIADIETVQSALEMYYDDFKMYPASASSGTACGTLHNNGSQGGTVTPNNAWCNSVQTLNAGQWIFDGPSGNSLVNYLPQVPVDPKLPLASANWTSGGFPVNVYYYATPAYSSPQTANSYLLIFTLEDKTNDLQNKDGAFMDDVSSGGSLCKSNGYKMQHFGSLANNNDGVITLGRNRGQNVPSVAGDGLNPCPTSIL